MLLLQKQNDCALEIFNHNSHLPHLSAKKTFLKIPKYFWRYSISAGTVYSEKLKFLHFLNVGKVVLLPLQTKIFVTLKFSTTIATFLVFQPKKSFWKFVKYFWTYSISAGTGEREKLKFLHILDVGKVGTLLLQNQNICALEIFKHNSNLPHLPAKKSFLKIR